MNHTLSVDIETYSETDIGKCGSFRYIEDPKFEVMLLGFGFLYQVGYDNGWGMPEFALEWLQQPAGEDTYHA